MAKSILQRIYDTGVGWVYYEKNAVDAAPGTSETRPNHTNNLVAASHTVLGEREITDLLFAPAAADFGAAIDLLGMVSPEPPTTTGLFTDAGTNAFGESVLTATLTGVPAQTSDVGIRKFWPLTGYALPERFTFRIKLEVLYPDLTLNAAGYYYDNLPDTPPNVGLGVMTAGHDSGLVWFGPTWSGTSTSVIQMVAYVLIDNTVGSIAVPPYNQPVIGYRELVWEADFNFPRPLAADPEYSLSIYESALATTPALDYHAPGALNLLDNRNHPLGTAGSWAGKEFTSFGIFFQHSDVDEALGDVIINVTGLEFLKHPLDR